MNAILTLPLDVAQMILEQVLAAPQRGWQGQDEKHQWTIGHDLDPETGTAFLQIVVEPLLVTAKD